jgi:UDP-N-acetylmuramate dehydrogenase
MLTVQENVSLKNYNTFRIDVKAKFFVEINNTDEFDELTQSDIRSQYPHVFLWWGANILFTKSIEGIVIKNSILGKHIIQEDETTVHIKVWSGESRPAFVNRCVEQWYQWIEKLALIPWTIWASAVGNIGAYGTEVKDIIYEVEYIDTENTERKILTNTKCQFAYRESIFKHELKDKAFITSVIFALCKVKDTTILKQAVTDIVALRQSKLPDPTQVWTAGSFFKNPIITQEHFLKLQKTYPNLIGHEQMIDSRKQETEFWILSPESWVLNSEFWVKLAAWQLIELCGLKGYRHGKAGVSTQHALVLINTGDCTGQEVRELADHIISEVKKNFWVTLEPEVIIM